MAGTGIGTILFREDDANGEPLAGGKLYTYEANTSIPLAVFNNPDLAPIHEHENPVILDAAGRALIYLQLRAYRFVLTDADDVEIYDVPSYSAFQSAGGAGGLDIAVTFGEDVDANDTVVISDGSGGRTAGRWYRGDADDPDLNQRPGRSGFATAAYDAGSVGFVRIDGTLDGFVGLVAGSKYYISAVAGEITNVPPVNARQVGVGLNSTTLLIGNDAALNTFDFLQARIFG